MTDYSQFEDDTEITDLFDDFANCEVHAVSPWYESEDCFEIKAKERELELNA